MVGHCSGSEREILPHLGIGAQRQAACENSPTCTMRGRVLDVLVLNDGDRFTALLNLSVCGVEGNVTGT